MDKPQTGLLLLEYFKKQKITLSSIAKAMGYSRETLSRRLNDNNDAPGYKVSAYLKELFAMQSLGKNAVDRTAKQTDFGQDYERLYNELLAFMGR